MEMALLPFFLQARTRVESFRNRIEKRITLFQIYLIGAIHLDKKLK